MRKILSYLKTKYAQYQRSVDVRVETRAQALFHRMLLEHEAQQIERLKAAAAEREELADAWMPFKTKRMTKGQAKALTFFDDAQIQALEVVEEEIRAELSNRALRADGVSRDKAMWAAVGVRMYLDAIKQKIESYGGRDKREQVKKAVEESRAEKADVRTMKDLYGERLIHA